MSISELKDLLHQHKVPAHWYALDEGLKPDALIIYKNYSVWEFFYLDEKGNRNDYCAFTKAEDAYQHLWSKIEAQLKFHRK